MKSNILREQVRTLLFANLREGYSQLLGRSYSYITPSPQTYPFQFWWDTCFHVFILCRLQEYEVAKRNMESLFGMQKDDGFVGHMIFWNKIFPRNISDVLQAKPTLSALRPHMSALLQPPLAAQAVERIYQGTGDKYFLYSMLPKLKKYFDWLAANRDFAGNGLLSLITSFESGIDWKPSYDRVVHFRDGKANWKLYWKIVLGVDGRNFLNRYDLQKIRRGQYFLVKDTLFNVLYSQDLKAFARLLKTANISEHTTYATRGVQVAQRIIELMYDENSKAFYDIYGRNNKQLPVRTFTLFAPLLMEETPKEIAKALVDRHLMNPAEFLTTYPIPSVAINEPAFSPQETKFLWRGPTWVVANWFLYHCLRAKNFAREAEKLAESVRALIAKSGFREYYHPFTGQGMGAKDFTWSGLIVDMASSVSEQAKPSPRSKQHQQVDEQKYQVIMPPH